MHRLTSQANNKAPGWPCINKCTCPLLAFVFELELRTSRAPQGSAPEQATKKSGRLQKLY